MTESANGWNDARLDAAFAARAAGAARTPGELVELVLAELPRRQRGRAWSSRPWLAAAAATAAIVGVVAVRAIPLGDGPRLASPTPSSPTVQTARPSEVAEGVLPTIGVSEALAIRDTGSDRELVVAGFLSPFPALPCPAVLEPRNPTRLECPGSFQWLMADPEIVMTIGAESMDGGQPKGAGFHPSFALVDAPEVPTPASGGVQPVPVVLMGHFHDRRAALCPPDRNRETPCDDTFVVDEVTAVNGVPRGVVTQLGNSRFDQATKTEVTEDPLDLEEDVDRLALAQVPGGSVVSRQLVTIDQVISLEPVLANDNFVPYVGNPATLMWLVTTLDNRADPAHARTFALMDGSNWFGEVTAKGMVMIERTGLAPPPARSGPPPSADPTAFDAAPASILGIPVRDLATVMRDRRADVTDLGRDEFAIRGWYLAPNPAAHCDEPVSPIHPPTPPCDEARHWLVDDPAQLATENGQARRNPEHWPSVLNPLLPVDVPFDVPATWSADRPEPVPVVVLGHFEDNRVDAYAGSVYLVIDALAWTPSGSASSLDTVTRLSTRATEDPAAVLARIDALSPKDPVATWLTVVDAADFAGIDPGTATDAPEFTTGAPVWIVRRLIHNEMDGRQRLAVEWAFTADGGERVWLTETPDSHVDLASSMNLRNIDRHTTLVRVFDYDRQIASVATTSSLGPLAWKRVGPDPAARLDVARGRSDREVAIRWTGASCQPAWQIRVQNLLDGKILVEPRTFSGTCDGDRVVRRILMTFDRAIDLDRIRTGDPCCG